MKTRHRASFATACAVLAIGLTGALYAQQHRLPDSAKPGGEITVVLRYDDYSSVSPTEIELKMLAALESHKMPCLFGVVPMPVVGDFLDPCLQKTSPLTLEKAAVLKPFVEKGVVQVALHGCTHQVLGLPPNGRRSEFEGLVEKSQEEKLARGKELLEERLGVKVRTFVPPFESYDLTTVSALEKLGFNCISADLLHDAPETSSLLFLPSTCYMAHIRKAVTCARLGHDPEPVVVALFHPYDFREADAKRGVFTCAEFEGLLDWLGAQKDVHVVSMDQALETIQDLGVRRYRKNAWITSLAYAHDPLPALVPAGWNPEATGVYQSTAAISRKMLASCLFVGAAYPAALLAGCGFAFWSGRRLGAKSRPRLRVGTYGCCAATLAVAAVLLSRTSGYKGVILLCLLAGLSAGAIWAMRKRSAVVE